MGEVGILHCPGDAGGDGLVCVCGSFSLCYNSLGICGEIYQETISNIILFFFRVLIFSAHHKNYYEEIGYYVEIKCCHLLVFKYLICSVFRPRWK